MIGRRVGAVRSSSQSLNTRAARNRRARETVRARSWRLTTPAGAVIVIREMVVVGVAVRVRDMDGEELGVAHVPPIVRVGDVLTVDGDVFEIYDLAERDDEPPIVAVVSVRPVKPIS